MFTFREPSNNLVEPRHIPNFLSEEEIKNIFNGLNKIPFQTATIESQSINDLRNSQLKWIPFSKEWEWLYKKLNNTIYQINQEFFKLDLRDMPEIIQYTEYSHEYNGKYDWHLDLGPIFPSSHRKISVTIQLSHPSEYEGGYLQLFSTSTLPKTSEEQKGLPYYLENSPKGLGSATLFPSFFPHRVTPVTKGVRKSLVIWVGGVPFK